MSVLGPVTGAGAVPGELRVLSCPSVLCPHAEFAVAAVLATPVSLRWSPQPEPPGGQQATLSYLAPPGTAGLLVSRLRRLGPLSFEVVEAASAGHDPERYSYHADLGLHRAALSASGDVVVTEGVLKSLLARSSDAAAPSLAHELSRLLGIPWDAALEPLRATADGVPVSVLRRTG